MKFERKNNTATVFLNQFKQKETHPDYTGAGLICGKKMLVSIWIKTDKNGNRYMSMSFQEPKPRVSVKDFESTQETYDEGLGEPQQDDFNKQIDKFQQEHKTTDEDNDVQVPF